MKRLILSAAFVTLGVGVMAQAQHPAGHDPDKIAASSGTLPAGWSARLDNGATKPDGLQRREQWAPASTSSRGRPGIYFRADRLAFSGPTTISAMFTQMEPAAHPEAYSVFIGGSDLQGANQEKYLVLRDPAGRQVPRSSGTPAPRRRRSWNWTENAAINKADPSGKMKNTAGDPRRTGRRTHFLVNGTEVAAVPIDRGRCRPGRRAAREPQSQRPHRRLHDQGGHEDGHPAEMNGPGDRDGDSVGLAAAAAARASTARLH